MPDPASPVSFFRSAAPAGVASLAVALAMVPALPAAAIVYRDDLGTSDQGSAISQNLAKQGQFAGVGSVSGATGTAISRDWVLTASHFTRDGEAATFVLNGTSYAGKAVHKNGTREGTDVALLRLDPGVRLPADTVFISPLESGSVVGELIWKVGVGGYGTATESIPGPSGLRYDGRLRAGTNIIDSKRANNTGPSLVFNRTRGAGATAYEVTTAPGDSGGPAFVQRGNQWFIAGETTGANDFGFIDGDVQAEIDFIRSATGLTFSSKAAPTALFWDPDFGVAGVQAGGGSWTQDRPTFTAGGFQYTWESDVAAEAVFGTPASGAGIITVDGQITASAIRFAPKLAGSGPFQVVAGSGALTAGPGGLTLDVQAFARLNASVVGGGDVRKTGASTLVFDGDNRTFSGEIFVDNGAVVVDRAETFGVGGSSASTRTNVASGATLQFRGDGFVTDERFRLAGNGSGGAGALLVSAGDHTITRSVILLDNSTVRVDAGASLTLGGSQGRFFQDNGVSATVTKSGDGTLVLNRDSSLDELFVADGVLAGGGGVTGTVTVGSSGELRAGDTAAATGIGTFRTDDFRLDAGGVLTLDLDAAAGVGDVLDVRGAASLAGTLALNLLSAPTAGASYVFLENDGLDAIQGLFANGPIVSAGFGGTTYDFLLGYAGGTGNDATLTLVAIPEPGTAAALAAVGLGLLGRRRRA